MKNSLTKLFSGGRPQMATAPTRKPRAVQGIRRARPPSRSISRVWAEWMTEPALKKSRALNSAWFQTCNKLPARPRTTQSARRSDLPIRASPRPMTMMPMFSMLW
jgi:hypothetical protein